MTAYFHRIPCNDLKDFLKKVEGLKLLKSEPSEPQWVFKGRKNATWDLKTTLERAFEQFGVPDNKRITIEKAMIREFQRRFHHYNSNAPVEGELDEWMALMQHYGAPTRLLDFTYSPYVAAYFAFEDACSNSEVAIWAINTSWCKDQLDPTLADRYSLYQQHRRQEDFKRIFMEDPPRRMVLGVNPYRLNERLASQKGTFLCPGDSTLSFVKNLSYFTGNDNLHQKVIKFTIPIEDCGKIRDKALLDLEYMNINKITLFQGLDGFAQSFEPRIPWFRTIPWGDFRF